MEPRNRFQGITSASLCSPAGQYDNPLPTRFLAPIDCLKIPAQDSGQIFKDDMNGFFPPTRILFYVTICEQPTFLTYPDEGERKMGDRPVKFLFHPFQLVWGENGSVRMESELEKQRDGFTRWIGSKLALLYTEYSSGMSQKCLRFFCFDYKKCPLKKHVCESLSF